MSTTEEQYIEWLRTSFEVVTAGPGGWTYRVVGKLTTENSPIQVIRMKPDNPDIVDARTYTSESQLSTRIHSYDRCVIGSGSQEQAATLAIILERWASLPTINDVQMAELVQWITYNHGGNWSKLVPPRIPVGSKDNPLTHFLA